MGRVHLSPSDLTLVEWRRLAKKLYPGKRNALSLLVSDAISSFCAARQICIEKERQKLY